MKRRDFSKYVLTTTGFLTLPISCNNLNVKTYDDKTLADGLEGTERVLVLIQLKGGNDGINTLIPLNQFDQYEQLRPTIGIKKEQVIGLDTTLAEDTQLGVHPSFMDVKGLYDEGQVSIIQSVAYPNVDGSHFKSTDLWMTGGDGTPEYNNIKTGWMGRFLKNAYPDYLKASDEYADPLGMQLGNPNASLGFHLEGDHKCSVNVSGQDPSGYYTNIIEKGGVLPTTFANSLFGKELEYLAKIQSTTSTYAKHITEVFNKGKNYSEYPDTDLSNQLKTVARLLHGGSRTKIFLVQLSDFDTHKDQVLEGDVLKGEHAVLLEELGGAVKAFLADIQQAKIGDQVVTMTFSEFGRKARENGSFGTDHGRIAPMFLFGKGLQNGVTGKNVDLSSVDEEGQLSGDQIDYRAIYTTILQDWLGASNQILDASNLAYYNKKLPLINKKQIIAPSNYIKRG